MHISEACKACVCVWVCECVCVCVCVCVWGVLMPLGCPAWYRTFLQGRSCNICQNAPPSNFFHSNFPSFQHGGHFFSLVSISDPSFPSVHSSRILLHENFSLPLCFSSLMSAFLTPVSNSSPPTVDEHRGNHFFLLAALSVSNSFFPPSLSLSLLFAPFKTLSIERNSRDQSSRVQTHSRWC